MGTVDSFHGRERVKVEDQRSAYPQSMSKPHEVHVRTKGHSRVKVTVPGFRSKRMYHRHRRHHDDGARVRVKVAEDLAKAKAPSYDGGPTSSVPEYKNWRDQFDAWQWRSAHSRKTGRHYDDDDNDEDDDDDDEGPATYLPLPANSTFKGSNSSDLTVSMITAMVMVVTVTVTVTVTVAPAIPAMASEPRRLRRPRRPSTRLRAQTQS